MAFPMRIDVRPKNSSILAFLTTAILLQNPFLGRDGWGRDCPQTSQKIPRDQKACEKASLSLFSDSDGDLQVILKVNLSGHSNQVSRRGGCQPRRREVEPSTLSPSSIAAPPAVAATTPAPARRARRHGPGALLRDERRRLARMSQTSSFQTLSTPWQRVPRPRTI